MDLHDNDSVHLCHSHVTHVCVVVWITGNGIGADGAKAIGWSLAFTPQLTCLDMHGQWREGEISNGWCVIGYWGDMMDGKGIGERVGRFYCGDDCPVSC